LQPTVDATAATQGARSDSGMRAIQKRVMNERLAESVRAAQRSLLA